MSCDFVIFTGTHKIPLTEKVSLRIVYAKNSLSKNILYILFSS